MRKFKDRKIAKVQQSAHFTEETFACQQANYRLLGLRIELMQFLSGNTDALIEKTESTSSAKNQPCITTITDDQHHHSPPTFLHFFQYLSPGISTRFISKPSGWRAEWCDTSS